MIHPLVSIILPTYNGAKTISRAIESVLAQSFLNWELIIVDDYSADDTEKVVSNFKNKSEKIFYFKNERNLGIQRSLNRGLKEANGEYIGRVDDDDIWVDPNKLKNQIDFLEQNPDYVLIGTNAAISDESRREFGTYRLPESDEAIRQRMLEKNCFIHPSIVARRSAMQKAGGYDESENTKHIEDYALWLRLGLIGKVANLSTPSVRLTVHKNSMTFQNRLVQARRMYAIVGKYKKAYPHFLISRFVLLLRVIGFSILTIVPMPRKLLYKIQKIYKAY